MTAFCLSQVSDSQSKLSRNLSRFLIHSIFLPLFHRNHPPPLADFLSQSGGYAVIDGGLATELQRHGADLNDPLWSAKCLVHSPDLIRRVLLHSLFLRLPVSFFNFHLFGLHFSIFFSFVEFYRLKFWEFVRDPCDFRFVCSLFEFFVGIILMGFLWFISFEYHKC